MFELVWNQWGLHRFRWIEQEDFDTLLWHNESKHMPKENGLYGVYWSEKCAFCRWTDHHTPFIKDTERHFPKKTRLIHSNACIFSSAQGYTNTYKQTLNVDISVPARKCFNLLSVSSIRVRERYILKVYCLHFRHANFRYVPGGWNRNANKIAAHQ